MKQWFISLEQREQQLVLLMAAFMAIAIVYFAIYQPLDERLTKAQKGVQRETQLLQWVEKNATEISKLKGRGHSKQAHGGSIDQIVNSSSRPYKFVFSRLQPQNKKLQVTLDKAKFTSILQWIQLLQQDYGLTVTVANFTAQSEPGLVKVKLVLSK